LTERDLDNLLSKASNKFLLVNATSGRAKQIVEGSLPYVNNFDPNNPVVTALREISADKLKIRVLTGPSKKPQDLLAKVEEEAKKARPSAMERLARDFKRKAPTKKSK
jgi:DNA-directed RNA polymerase omega subunit